MLSEQEMRQAVAVKSRRLDGQFFYSVINSGVYCQPSCNVTPENMQNLCFFATANDAEKSGLKACQCCIECSIARADKRLIEVATYIENHAEERLTLAQLALVASLSPSQLQRVFKAAFGISPKAYQDAVRMRKFKQRLQTGQGVTDAIFSSGFGSVSRVYGEGERKMGMTPKKYQAGGEGEVISYAVRDTALGLLMMAATDKGVCFVQFGQDPPELVASLKVEFPKAVISHSCSQHSQTLDDWIDALEQHLSHGAPKPIVPIDMQGTVFQMKVWTFLLSVKEGDVLSYSELASQIGQPKAVRAAASACGKNRIAILIPCHRVLRSDGGLGGYRWGLMRKQALLALEKAEA